jgi:HlyD family secretion protein
VELGEEAEFGVDAFPGQTFHGRVKQIRNAPKTDQNVVTYSTMVEVSNPDLKLKPGMTANVSIIVARREQALRIPNAALRFHPPARAEAAKTSAAPGHKKDQRKSDWVVYLLTCQAGMTNLSADGSQGTVLQPVPVRTGINNASFTEVVDGLKEGDEVVSGLTSSKAASSHTLNPFGSGPRH